MLVAVLAAGGATAALPGITAASAPAGSTAGATFEPTPVGALSISPSWSIAELRGSPTVAAPYDEAGFGLPGAVYAGAPSLVNSANPAGKLDILLTLRFSNATRLDSLLSGLQDPASSDYHHYLSANEFDAEFGSSPTVYASIVRYLGSFGVTGLTTRADRLSISLEATPSQAAALFHTRLGAFVSATGEPYFAPLSAPEVPSLLAPYLVDVEGLSNYSEYLDHVAPLAELHATAAPGLGVSLASHVSPGGSGNPFASTTVTSNGLTETYDAPLNENLSGRSGSCATNTCGDFLTGAALQVTYNETGLFAKYGFPKNASVAAILWSDTICHSSGMASGVGGTCGANGLFNHFCSTLTAGSAAWDFYLPDVTSFWNYSIPSGEPMPRAVSEGITGYTYAFPAHSQGYSASCDDAAAESENTVDVDMLGSMAPGANVFQVFGGSSSTTAIDTVFTDILSPSTSVFTTTGGFDTASNVQELENVSVITNSWTASGALPAAWTTDLQTAAARGITVLAATGDSGTTVAPPAAIAQNTYGVVAVGGTTLVPTTSSLMRGPPHLASSASPYYGVGRGEIGWYAPKGTVEGFSATYGGVGGVASSTSYPRATWFNASADAVAIANTVRSGNFRGEPDLAAIANDTLLDLDQGPVSGNFTCWVTTSCTKNGAIAIGTTAGSQPTVEGFYLIGTSISDQVAGGLVATIDHALRRVGQGWLGELDPILYPQGQLQFTGDLRLRSFYDVNTYTDGGGLTTAYEAKGGYDLATGWGALDAGNLTQNTLTYPTTFTESGLSGVTSWTVKVTPTIGDSNCVLNGAKCGNPTSSSSTSSSLAFSEPYGAFTYTASASGYSAPAGSFHVRGAAGAVAVVFSRISVSPSASLNPLDVGQSTTITAGASGGSGVFTGYSWSGLPTGCAAGSVASFACAPSAGGTSSVHVTVTDSNGGQASGSFTLVVDASLAVAPSASADPVDEGETTTISGHASGGAPPYTYSWSGLPSGCGAPGSVASFVCTPAMGDAAGSPYSVTLDATDANGRTVGGSFLLNVDPALSAGTTSATPNPTDVGLSTTIQTSGATGGSGSYAYVWSGLPSGCTSVDAAELTCTPSASGAREVSLTVSDSNGGSATSSFLLHVSDALAASPAASVNPVDAGQATTLSADPSGGTGAYSYRWSGLPSGCGVPGNVASFPCTPASGDAAGSPYTVVVTAMDASGGTAEGSLVLVVDPTLTVAAPSASPNPVPSGTPTTISTTGASGGGGGYSYSWSGLPAACSAGDVVSFTCSPEATGIYSVSVTVIDANGQTDSASFVLRVESPIGVAASASVDPVDELQTTTITAELSNGTGPFSFVWGGLPSGCASPGNVSSFPCTPAPGDANGSTYSVSVSVTDATGGAGHASFQLTVEPALRAASSATVDPVDVGETTLISGGAAGGSPSYRYAWTGLPSGCGVPGSVASFACTPAPGDAASSPYTVELSVTDANGGVASSSFVLVVDPALGASASATIDPVTEGERTSISAEVSGGAGPYAYVWSGLPAGCGAPGDIPSFVCTPPPGDSSGSPYNVLVTVTDANGGNRSVGFALTVDPQLRSAPSASANPVDLGLGTTISAVASGGASPYQYAWSGLPSGCSAGNVGSFSCTPLVAGRFIVNVTVTDANGAVANASLLLRVLRVQTYSVTFTESGLPLGTGWEVAVGGGPTLSGTGGSLSTALPNGSYAYRLQTANPRWAAEGGELTINGTAAAVGVEFVLQLYTISFTESGLPATKLATAGWTVVLNGSSEHGNSAVLEFPGLPNGTYSVLITGAGGFAASGSGTVTIAGTTSVAVSMTRAKLLSLRFHERGLDRGTEWCVTLDGAQTCSTTASLRFAHLSAGSYQYAVEAIAGWTLTARLHGLGIPTNGTLSLSRSEKVVALYAPSAGGSSIVGVPLTSGASHGGAGGPGLLATIALVLLSVSGVLGAVYLLRRSARGPEVARALDAPPRRPPQP